MLEIARKKAYIIESFPLEFRNTKKKHFSLVYAIIILSELVWVCIFVIYFRI